MHNLFETLMRWTYLYLGGGGPMKYTFVSGNCHEMVFVKQWNWPKTVRLGSITFLRRQVEWTWSHNCVLSTHRRSHRGRASFVWSSITRNGQKRLPTLQVFSLVRPFVMNVDHTYRGSDCSCICCDCDCEELEDRYLAKSESCFW